MTQMSTVLSTSNQTLYQRLGAGLCVLWGLLREPDALYLGLKKKWLLPACLLLSLILVPVALVPTAHLLLEKLYPPVEKKLIFGLYTKTSTDERLEGRKAQAEVLLWTLSGAAVLVGLMLYAPTIRMAADAEKERLLDTLRRDIGGQGPFRLEDRYRIEEQIGSGAMGVVFSAFDKTLERPVALKELPAAYVKDPERRERFRREALTLAKLTHPGIVPIYDLLDDGDRMILVMELVGGGTLADLIAERAPVAVEEACGLIGQICETLDHVQQNGIVHRDLKPANILIDNRRQLKVTDFGIARLVRESGLTIDGSLMGSPQYMSPEQAKGKTSDFRSDIYSLGVIFYQLLTGSPPFSGEPAAVLLQQISDPPPSLQGRIAEPVDAVEQLVMAMLRKEPAERISDYREIARQLHALGG